MQRVLLIDDDPLVTRAMQRLLDMAGFEVRHSNHSYGMLNLVAEIRPDVVVLDMRMPGLSGHELVELLRSDAELSHTRVLLYSGIDEKELASRAIAAGADGFVHKSSPPVALISALRSLETTATS